MGMIAKEGTVFKVISPQISAGGIENLDSLYSLTLILS